MVKRWHRIAKFCIERYCEVVGRLSVFYDTTPEVIASAVVAVVVGRMGGLTEMKIASLQEIAQNCGTS